MNWWLRYEGHHLERVPIFEAIDFGVALWRRDAPWSIRSLRRRPASAASGRPQPLFSFTTPFYSPDPHRTWRSRATGRRHLTLPSSGPPTRDECHHDCFSGFALICRVSVEVGVYTYFADKMRTSGLCHRDVCADVDVDACWFFFFLYENFGRERGYGTGVLCLETFAWNFWGKFLHMFSFFFFFLVQLSMTVS